MERKYKEIIAFLRKYQEHTNVKGYVLGISGGKDSAVVAKLLVDSIGKENVLGVLMPDGRQVDIEDSYAIGDFLNINYTVINIKDIVDASIQQIYFSKISTVEGKEETLSVIDKAVINIFPRIRMTILYAIAQSKGYRVAGTSNASELFIGWGTKWGDLASDINPISQLTCSEVIALGDYMGLPYDLIHKTPADGLTGRSDEDNFGFTYQELDALIKKVERLDKTGHLESPFTEIELRILKLHDAAYHKDHVIKIH